MTRWRPATVLAGALVVAFGIFAGLGMFTFIYAKGYSYLADDPQACVNCHVMRDNYNAWAVSSHRNVTCNGCHTPHDVVGKYFVKAEHGFNHSYVFTFGNPQVIHIKQRSLEVVEHNCIECHASTVATIFGGSAGRVEPGPLRRVFNVESLGLPKPAGAQHEESRCTTCHRGVGHAF
jgi:cytochrome c nitrite reductase small subunit